MRHNIILGVIVYILVSLVYTQTDILDRVENITLDMRTKFRVETQADPHEALVMVGIDEESLAEYGMWPWNRTIHAGLLDWMATISEEHLPKSLGWDIMFIDNANKIEDEMFSNGISNVSIDVILGALSDKRIIEEQEQSAEYYEKHALGNIEGDISNIKGAYSVRFPIPELLEGSKLGFVSVDNEGIESLQGVYLVQQSGGKVYPSLVLSLLMSYWELESEHVTIKLGKEILLKKGDFERSITIDEKGLYRISAHCEMPSISYLELFQKVVSQQTEFLKEKIVVIGCLPSESGDNLLPQNPKVDPIMDALNSILNGDTEQAGPHEALVLVNVDKATIDSFWNRNCHAMFLSQMAAISKEHMPRAFGWDVKFIEPANANEGPEKALADGKHMAKVVGKNLIADEDKAFAAGIKAVPFDVILGAFSDDSRNPNRYALDNSKIEGDINEINGELFGKFPVLELLKSSKLGFVNAEHGKDGMVRVIPLVERAGKEVYPSLALASLMSYWGLDASHVTVRLGKEILLKKGDFKRSIPIDGHAFYRINYRYEMPSIGYKTLATRIVEGRTEFLKDKIMVVGHVAVGLSDIGPSPLVSQSPRVNVHMNAIDNILKEDYIKKAWFPLIMLIFLTISFLIGRVLSNHSLMWTAGLQCLTIVPYVGAGFWAFNMMNMHMPFVAPIAAFLIHQGILLGEKLRREQAHKKEIQGMFGTYVSPELVDQMIDSGEEPQLGGEEVEITAFFSDIASFSSFSERLTSVQLVDIMNQYLTAMTDILDENDGTLDKYIGDAIVALYGAPIRQPDHAHRAAVAACKLQRKQIELRKQWEAEGDKWIDLVFNMQTRVGLNTGMATVGNMGSEKRFNYTMMGDTVNLAARSESGAKSYGVYTMVTETLYEGARKDGDDFWFRYLDKIIVKGRTKPVVMYELLGMKGEVEQGILDCMTEYDIGIKKYLSKEWDASIAAFEKSSELEDFKPGSLKGIVTNPSLMMIKRCQAYKENPPPGDWDGVFIMTTK